MSLLPSITLIIKLTQHCNLACRYCYDGQFAQKEIGFISSDLLRKTLDEAISMATKHVQFIWHGSEPLLYSPSLLHSILEEAMSAAKNKGLRVENSIQTNGTLVDKTWANLFRDFSFKVGISFDGTREIHDQNRVFKNGRGTADLVTRSMELLRQENVSFGTLSVISKTNFRRAKEIYSGLKDAGVLWMDFSPNIMLHPYEDGFTPGAITADEHAMFIIDLFDAWMSDGDDRVYVRYLANILDAIFGGEPTLCKLAGTCMDYFLTVTFDGDVYPCDSFVGIKDMRIGNLNKDNLNEIVIGEPYQIIRKIDKKKRDECVGCRWFFCCKGGCRYEQLALTRGMKKEYRCDAEKQIFEYVHNRVQTLLPQF